MIIAIILSTVKPFSTIWSDQWKAYNTLSNYGFNHSKNFVDPSTGVNTQKIEGTWNIIKQFLDKNGECCKCTQFVRTFWRLFPQFRSFWMSLKSNRKKNIFNPFKKNSKNHVSRYLLYFNICYSASFVHDDNKFFVLNDQIFLKLFNI